MGNKTAERLEALLDAEIAAGDDISPEVKEATENAKAELIMEAVDNANGPKLKDVFIDNFFHIIIGSVVLGFIGMAAVGTVHNYQQLVKKSELRQDAAQIMNSYQQWLVLNNNATPEQKKQYVLNAVKAEVGDVSHVGIAFDENTKDGICIWKNNIDNSRVDRAVSYVSNNADCSRMDILASPEGTSIVKDTSEKPAEAPLAAPPVKKESNGVADAANTVMLVGGAVIAVGAVGTGVGFGAKKAKANSRRKKRAVKDWEDAMERHDSIRKSWALYELDPMKMLDYPVLSDMRETVTVQLHAALRKANLLRPVDAKVAVSEEADFSKYLASVDALEIAFHSAENEAKRVQWSKFNADEQKRLMTAKNLLNFVLDANGSEFERQAAYKRLAKEINGLLVLPDMTLQALESNIRQMLTEQRN